MQIGSALLTEVVVRYFLIVHYSHAAAVLPNVTFVALYEKTADIGIAYPKGRRGPGVFKLATKASCNFLFAIFVLRTVFRSLSIRFSRAVLLALRSACQTDVVFLLVQFFGIV